MMRSPAVAGQFYPGRETDLRETLSRLCVASSDAVTPRGIMSPHAGYIYSGAVAGKLFSRITVPDKVLLLGPNHHGAGKPGALYAAGSWLTPLGEIKIDPDLAAQLLASCRHFSGDEIAHRSEHSLEVQVPFIQYCNPEAKLVPVCLGHLSLDALIESGESIAGVIAASEEPILLIASSDMTHFESSDQAREKDFMALNHVENLDPEGLYRTVRDNRISMCGVLPTVVMLAAARKLGAEKGELVAYSTSGDVTGDNSDVVGYAAVIVR